MTTEEFEKEINDLFLWMRDSSTHPELTGDKIKDRESVITQIKELYNSDIYEVRADFHLSNGDVIKIRNRCLESFCNCGYAGDRIEVYKGWLNINYEANDGVFHQTIIRPESVCWIDEYKEDVNWNANLSIILRRLRIN